MFFSLFNILLISIRLRFFFSIEMVFNFRCRVTGIVAETTHIPEWFNENCDQSVEKQNTWSFPKHPHLLKIFPDSFDRATNFKLKLAKLVIFGTHWS